MRTTGLNLRLVNLPGYSPDFNADSDVIFNMCQPRVGDRKDLDSGMFHVYKSVLHEAGHMLGLSGFSYGEAARGDFYGMSHPTIPDSVMNYDEKPDENLDSNGTHVRFEPDCAPHPFDIMALHALYQMVK